MVAMPAATSPHGWVNGPRARANHSDMLSTPVCHLGGSLGGFGLPSRRYWRTAMTSSTTPIRILTASAANEGAVLGLGGLLPVTRMVSAITMARDSSQPKMKAAPLRTPFFEARTTMNAVNGIGSSEITRPMRMRSRVMCVPPSSSRYPREQPTSRGLRPGAQDGSSVGRAGGGVHGMPQWNVSSTGAGARWPVARAVSYTHLRAHETVLDLV